MGNITRFEGMIIVQTCYYKLFNPFETSNSTEELKIQFLHYRIHTET
jgi:hypothetical protein